MTHDEKAMEQAVEAYRQTACWSMVPANHSEALRAAITAYQAEAAAPKMVKLTPEDERLLEKALMASTEVLYPVLPDDAADARVVELESALQPFVRLAEAYFYRYETRPGEWRESHENDPDDRAVYGINRVEITTGDFRRARKALEDRSSGLADATPNPPASP